MNTQKKHIGAEIYIPDNKEKFHLFELHKEEIDEFLGGKTEWKMANKATRILLKLPIDINSNLEWTRAYDWLAEKAIAFKRIARRFGR